MKKKATATTSAARKTRGTTTVAIARKRGVRKATAALRTAAKEAEPKAALAPAAPAEMTQSKRKTLRSKREKVPSAESSAETKIAARPRQRVIRKKIVKGPSVISTQPIPVEPSAPGKDLEKIETAIAEKRDAPIKLPAVVTSTPPASQPLPRAAEVPQSAAKGQLAVPPSHVPASAKATAAPKPQRKLPFEIPKILLEGDEPVAQPVSGPGRKFDRGPVSDERGAATIQKYLPAPCGSGKLTLVPRDPHCLYAFWDLAPEQQRACNAASLHKHLFVRLHRADPGRQMVNETAVHPESRHWFIHVPHAGTNYVGELGYYASARDWVGVAASNPAATPGDQPSVERTAVFADIREVRAITAEQTVQQAALPASGAQPAHRESPRSSKSVGHVRTFEGSLTAWESPRHHTITRGERTAPAPTDWSPAQEQALEEIITSAITRQEWFDSLQFLEMIEERRARGEKRPILPTVELLGPSSAELVSVTPEVQLEAISSPGGAEMPRARERQFWFNVNAELILYGATEPNARVTIGGREIKLRPDGTFSYRFSLPDGFYELPAAAISIDDETRRAELRFTRHTAYIGEVGAHPQDPTLKVPAAENVA